MFLVTQINYITDSEVIVNLNEITTLRERNLFNDIVSITDTSVCATEYEYSLHDIFLLVRFGYQINGVELTDSLRVYTYKRKVPESLLKHSIFNKDFTIYINVNGLITIGGTDNYLKAEKVIIPEGIEYIEDLGYNTRIKQITLPDSIVGLGGDAFKGCTNLESIKLSNNLSVIGEWCFYDCVRLKSIDIPDSVKTLYYNVFENCVSLEEVRMSKNIAGLFEADELFMNCNNLKRLYVSKDTHIDELFVKKLPKRCSLIKY